MKSALDGIKSRLDSTGKKLKTQQYKTKGNTEKENIIKINSIKHLQPSDFHVIQALEEKGKIGLHKKYLKK